VLEEKETDHKDEQSRDELYKRTWASDYRQAYEASDERQQKENKQEVDQPCFP
jgi:hypothetical protein